MMRKVVHEIIVNVETGAYTATPPIDIHQGDSNSHELLIKLRNSQDRPIQISNDGRARISFQRKDSIRVDTYQVEVVNPYRGVLSYVLGPAIVNDYGRYTCRLDLTSPGYDADRAPAITFVVNVSRSHMYEGGGAQGHEVTISESFYRELNQHLEGVSGTGEEIHLVPADRDFLDKFTPMGEELNEVLNMDFDKEISDSVIQKASQVVAQAFITVDFKSQLGKLKRSELVDGKIVRVNYPMHDGDSSTVEPHDDAYSPAYYVCKLLGNDETVEWHQISFAGGSALTEELFEKMNTITARYDSILNEFTEYHESLSQLSTIESRIQDDEDRIDSAESRIQSNENRLSGVESRVQNDENRLDNIDLRIQDTETRLSDAELRIHNTETRLDSVESTVTLHSQKVDSLGRVVSWKNFDGSSESDDTEEGDDSG